MKWVGVQEFADHIGLSYHIVKRLLASKQLPGMKSGSRWYIPQDFFDEHAMAIMMNLDFAEPYTPEEKNKRKPGPYAGTPGFDFKKALAELRAKKPPAASGVS